MSLVTCLQTALSGFYPQIVSSGASLQTTSVGAYPQITSLGTCLQIVSLGAYPWIVLSGTYPQIVSLDICLQIVSSVVYLQDHPVLLSSIPFWWFVLLKICFRPSLGKEDSPPPTQKGGKPLEGIMEEEFKFNISNDNKKNSENIQKFHSAICLTSQSQFLVTIDSEEFLKTFAATLDDPERMSDCVQGIQPCEWKGNGHQWLGNQVFRWLGLTKEKKKKWDLWKRSPKTFWGI